MGRIRTIKPEFFLNEGLFDLELSTGLPVRLVFAGLWCQSDRAGRFYWRPRTLKSQILPFDEVDFSRTLDVLENIDSIRKYVIDGIEYGYIPNWTKHQFINNREAASELPEPPDFIPNLSELNEIDASSTRQIPCSTESQPCKAEGKGREGDHGKERNMEGEGKGKVIPPSRKRSAGSPSVCDDEWLDELQAKPVYASLDVRRLYAKMVVWCENKRMAPTRQRFVNWLNKEDLPLSAGTTRTNGIPLFSPKVEAGLAGQDAWAEWKTGQLQNESK